MTVAGCVRDAFTWSQEMFSERSPEDMALSQGAKIDGRVIRVSYLTQVAGIGHPHGDIVENIEPALSHGEHILCLQYLAGMGALPPRKPWKSFLELPGGPHHHDLFCAEAIDPISRRFGDDIDGFRMVCERFGGDSEDIGVAAFQLTVFPKLSLLVTLHEDAGGVRANVLFDSSAIHHLQTASLYVLGIEVSRRLRADRGTAGI